MKAFITSVILVVFSLQCFSMGKESMLLYGIYGDNFNGINLKLGVDYALYQGSYKEASINESGITDVAIRRSIYTEGEYGSKGYKVTVGYNETVCCAGNIRAGVSYAEIEDKEYIGIEGIFTALFLAFKAGVYQNMDSEESKYLLGMGIGW